MAGERKARGTTSSQGTLSRRRMYLRMITRSFWNRLSRAIIASLSIAVGAATLSGLGIIAFTVPEQMALQLRSYGANMVVLPQAGSVLTDQTVEQVDQILAEQGAELIGRAAYQYGNLLYNQQSVTVMGTDVQAANTVRPYWQVDGELPADDDGILIGSNVAERYRFEVNERVGFSSPSDQAGSTADFVTITGILRTGGPEDDMVTMSSAGLARFEGSAPIYSVIEYSINSEQSNLEVLGTQINQELTDVDAEVVRRISQAESGIVETLQSLIWLVAVIICVLTLISVTTTLQTVVAERAKEIGLKKALGALSSDITTEFTGEAVLLGLVGGTIGLVAGVVMAETVTRQAFAIDVSISPWIVPITLAASAAISVAGSLLPARRIAAIQPVTVLGGE